MEPDPIGAVLAALVELRALHCADPAATRANEAVRLTANTLELFWLRELGSNEVARVNTVTQHGEARP